jgi:hypothetical protein
MNGFDRYGADDRTSRLGDLLAFLMSLAIIIETIAEKFL